VNKKLNDTFAKAMFQDVDPNYVHKYVISDGKGGTYILEKTQRELDEEYDTFVKEV
jgi:hypothetical protein